MQLAAGLVSALIGCRLAAGLARARLGTATPVAARLEDLPAEGLPLARAVTVWWNDHHIPFVHAATDADAAVALGVVHAHLRLAQMEVMRRIATGRVAEMLGPAALPLDHGLRLLDFPRAVPAILSRMPAWTRAWVEGFAAGVTHVVRHAPLPPDFAMLGLARERWTAADVLAVGRLASADVNWIVLFNMLRLRGRGDWPELWAELIEHGGAGFAPVEDLPLLGRVATAATRSGSNALAVAGHRSASGGALLATDPHLSLTLPGPWLAAGVKCPSIHACGLMIPGLPFVAVGRNRVAAWSGTSLQAASSDLVDARALPVRERASTLRARWARPAAIALRDTALGPLISDCPLVGTGAPTALAWMGHRPSDELSAWLGVARAECWEAFAAAADGMAVPGQHLVYADRTGRIGKLLAAHLPRRPDRPPPDLVLAPAEARAGVIARSRDLPSVVDPAGGVVASANERPHAPPVRVGSFFPAPDRYLRLHRLVPEGKVGLDDLAAIQADQFSQTSVDLAAWICARIDAPVLAAWDGHYREESRGAAALELMVARLHRALLGDVPEAYWAGWNPDAVMRRRLEGVEPDRLRRMLTSALPADPPPWGDIHRLRLEHWTGMLPGLGPLARLADLPAGGGNDTVHKTAHGLAQGGPHAVRFGADARFLTDTADPDSSRVVLLGGQDGWLGSATFLDQVPVWRAGKTIALPLRPETVRATFAHRTMLRP